MKVVDQLIRYLRARNYLSPREVEVLIENGFLARECAEEEQQAVLPTRQVEEVDGLDARQDRLEGIAGRKGKRSTTEPTESVKRWWRTFLADKRRGRARA